MPRHEVLGNADDAAPAGSDGNFASPSSPALSASYDMWAGYLLGVSPASMRSYAGDMRDTFAYFMGTGVVPLAVTRRDIEGYLHDLRVVRGLSAATAARRCSVLAGYLRYAAEEGVIPVSPMA